MTEEMSSENFDWNVKATYAIVTTDDPEEYAPTDFTKIIAASNDPPENESDVSAFIQIHDLNHGDVVNFSPDYRYSDCYIVTRNSNGDLGWLINPDDAAAGYLTIPETTLLNVTDFRNKYADFLVNEDIVHVNFHPSSNDVFLKELFGENHSFNDDKWTFDVFYDGGEQLYVSRKDMPNTEELDVLQLGKTNGLYSYQDVLNYFETNFTSRRIKVSLLGAKLEEYKSKYSGDDLSWLKASPSLPYLCKLEKGQGLMSSTEYEWDWNLKAPENSIEECLDIVKKFLQGFQFSIVSSN